MIAACARCRARENREVGLQEKDGANACAGFNGPAKRKGIPRRLYGTTKKFPLRRNQLRGKGENRKAA